VRKVAFENGRKSGLEQMGVGQSIASMPKEIRNTMKVKRDLKPRDG
jgi:hypothetical protein